MQRFCAKTLNDENPPFLSIDNDHPLIMSSGMKKIIMVLSIK